MSSHTLFRFAAIVSMGCAAMMHTEGSQSPIFSEADAYEHFMGRWSRTLAPQLVKFAGVQDGDAVLDIGSGTGALSAAVLAAAPSSRIIGIDPSAPYVDQARAKHGSERVTFEVGDAQKMRFQNATFDRTLSMLVLNFIPDAGKAVSEMKRVTRKGGTIAAAVWDYGDGMEMLRVFWDEAVAADPAAERKDERHMKYCARGQLSALWREQGLTAVAEEALTIPTHFVSFEDYWSPFLEKQGPAGAYVATLSAAARDTLRDRLRRRLVGEGPDKGFTLHARAWAARGVVP